jgi:predicted  nucleic acid-binding Zn-ribbon protein
MRSTNVHRALLVVITASLCSSLAFAGSNTNKGANPNGKPFIELAGQIVEVQNDVSTLQQNYDLINQRINALETDLQGQIDAVKGEIANLHAADTAMQTSLTAAVADIQASGIQIDNMLLQLGSVNQQLATLEASIGDNTAAIADLNTQKDAIEAEIATNADGIVSALAAITENAQLIDMLQADVAALENSKQNDVDMGCPTGQFVRTVNDDGSVLCGQANSAGVIVSYRVQGSQMDLDNFRTSQYVCDYYSWGSCVSYHYNYYLTNGSRSASLSCPAGYAVSGGGYLLGGNQDGTIQVQASYPYNSSSWYFDFRNTATGLTANYSAVPFIQCLKVQ